jgi:hypothetical protein
MKLGHVETYVKSLTHNWFGRCALNWRFTRGSPARTRSMSMLSRSSR